MTASEKLGGQFKRFSGDNSDSYEYIKTEREPVFAPAPAGEPDTLGWGRATGEERQVPKTHLSMSLSHKEGTQAYVSPRPEGMSPRWQGNSPYDVDFAAAREDLETPGPGGQLKLFGMHNTEGTSTVDYMTGTREGSRHAMTMLGIAQNRNIAERGRSLIPDESLSPHSHKLAKHLAEKTGNESLAPATSMPTNNMSFKSEPDTSYLADYAKTIPEAEVRQGRNLIRGVIKGTRSIDPRGHAPLPPPTGGRRPGPVNPDQFTLF